MINAKPLLLSLSILALSCGAGEIKTVPLVQCWSESYRKAGIDFTGELDKFEQQLLEAKVLKSKDAEAYGNLRMDIFNKALEVNALSETVTLYISPAAFKECTANFKSCLNQEDPELIKYGTLFSIYYVLSQDLAAVRLHLTEEHEIFVDGEKTKLENLAALLKVKTAALAKKGVPLEEVSLKLKVDKETKMGFVMQVQELIKKSDLTKIMYTTPE